MYRKAMHREREKKIDRWDRRVRKKREKKENRSNCILA